MRAVLILLIVLLITSGIVYAARGWMAARARSGPWRLEERSDGELITLRAVRPGDEPLLLGSAPIGAQDFDDKLHMARAEAREKIAALNA